MTVRLATDEEAALVHAAMQAAYAQYIGKLDPPSGANTETIADVHTAMGRGGAALAFWDGSVAGSVRFRPEADHLYMERLAVQPELRRRGVASALVRFVEEEAERLYLPSVRLGVRLVLLENWRLYLGLGYRFRSFGLRLAKDGFTVSATMEKPHLPDGASRGVVRGEVPREIAEVLEIARGALSSAVSLDAPGVLAAARDMLSQRETVRPSLLPSGEDPDLRLRQLAAETNLSHADMCGLLGLMLNGLDLSLSAICRAKGISEDGESALHAALFSPPD